MMKSDMPANERHHALERAVDMTVAWRSGDVDAYRGALARTDEVGPAVWAVMDLLTVAVNELATVTGWPWEALLGSKRS